MDNSNIIDLCKAKEINVAQMLQVIEAYIKAKKGVVVKIDLPEVSIKRKYGNQARLVFRHIYTAEFNKISHAFDIAREYFL